MSERTFVLLISSVPLVLGVCLVISAYTPVTAWLLDVSAISCVVFGFLFGFKCGWEKAQEKHRDPTATVR